MALRCNLQPTFARTQSVAQTFIEAVDAFNAQDWNIIGNFLDPHVVVYNIDNVAYVAGRANVVAYFKTITDPELFEPTNNINFFPSIFPLKVYGVALWTHKAHNHVKVPINYECQFAPGSLLITSLWAAHSS